jgi:hypothetical protein
MELRQVPQQRTEANNASDMARTIRLLLSNLRTLERMSERSDRYCYVGPIHVIMYMVELLDRQFQGDRTLWREIGLKIRPRSDAPVSFPVPDDARKVE